jgi:hypothetical protein
MDFFAGAGLKPASAASGKNYSSSMVIASTGQFSSAASQHSKNSQPSGSITRDFSSIK